jgi:ABC-2 type transport system permease protein
MQWVAFRALVRKDLQLFLTDRRALIMSFIAPIAIASFFGSLFGGPSDSETARIPVAIVDEDGSAVSQSIAAGAQGDKTLKLTTTARSEARAGVRTGQLSVAVVIPKGFGEAAGQAFFAGGTKPALTMWYDPSRGAELGMVRGIMTQHVMEAVSREMFGGASGRRLIDSTLQDLDQTNLAAEQRDALRNLLQSAQRFYAQPFDSAQGGPAQSGQSAGSTPRGFTMPYTVSEEAVTSRANVAYNGYAHSFAGMGAQFVLFAMIDLGIGILLERQRGLWRRLRSAPLSRAWLLAGKAASGAMIGFATMIVAFAFAIIVFKVRIAGSVPGFIAVTAAYAVMASTFGLLIASIGQTPGGTRGVAILASLMMVMLGGAWVPAFIFPAWLQQATLVIPVRWAIDGLDAMTWRGLGIEAAVLPTVILLAFAIAFGSLAVARFRWEEA